MGSGFIVSDSIEMTENSRKKSHFLSLKWKALLSLVLLLTTLTFFLAWHYQERYNDILQQRLAELRTYQVNELEKTIYRSSDELNQVVNSVLSTVPNSSSLSSEEKTDLYRDQISNVLPNLLDSWHVEEALLVDEKAVAQFHYTNQSSLQSMLVPLLTQSNPITNSSARQIICQARCIQILNFPIIENNERIATLSISRSLHKLAEVFKDNTRTNLLLFFNSSAWNNTDTATASPQHLLSNWNGFISTTNDFPFTLVEALNSASQNFSLQELGGASRHVAASPEHLAISLLPVRGNEDLSIRFILIQDISAEYLSFVQDMRGQIMVISLLVAIFSLFLISISLRYFLRVNQQIEVLPLLGENKFSHARDVIQEKNKRHFIKDELDILDDAVVTLSYQLESLDKTVNKRTREMERLSLFDSLTGLANRNLLQYELEQDVQDFQQEGGILGVVILDLDNFKRINDSIGHQLGDLLLGKIGSRLKNATRSIGLVARLGGDEFAIILRSAKKMEQVDVACQKIIELIQRPLELDDHSISISCSLGVALAGNNQSSNDMIKNAEIAMYKAKEAGGNAYRTFNDIMAAEAHANLSLEADIRRAFDNKEFTLYLQPKVNMEREITGFEALIRWDHPDRGLVPPAEFIPAMEAMGLISQLDNFVLDASCRQLKVLQGLYPEISIAVNISSTHFTDKNFLVFLKKCLQTYPIDPSRLELEITETMLMENMNVGLEMIEEIKALGVSIAIDDFGTGYSSLSYLKKLPVDIIKIDREFIKDIPESESDMQISSVIIFLAKQLNFTVVAEGVETSEQLVFLRANQCDMAQGYLFSKAIPAHKAMLLLEAQIGGEKLGIA